MIKQINFVMDTGRSNLYLFIRNLPQNLDLPLTPNLGVAVDKIVKDYPVIEVNEETGVEMVITTPTIRQIITAINPAQLQEICVKDGVEYIKVIIPIDMEMDDNNVSTFNQIQSLLIALKTPNLPRFVGNIYTELKYNQLIQPYDEYTNPTGMGGWDSIIRL